MINFEGLVRQYGAMGIKRLANLHQNGWSIKFFMEKFNTLSRE